MNILSRKKLIALEVSIAAQSRLSCWRVVGWVSCESFGKVSSVGGPVCWYSILWERGETGLEGRWAFVGERGRPFQVELDSFERPQRVETEHVVFFLPVGTRESAKRVRVSSMNNKGTSIQALLVFFFFFLLSFLVPVSFRLPSPTLLRPDRLFLSPPPIPHHTTPSHPPQFHLGLPLLDETATQNMKEQRGVSSESATRTDRNERRDSYSDEEFKKG